MMSDITILKEMITDNATVSLQDGNYGGKKVILEEPNQYAVTIYGMPLPNEVIVIKGDAFPSLKNRFFRNKKHECKRADFIIVANTKNKRVILYVELKATLKTSEKSDILLQFKGAQCVMTYCQEIGREFWEQLDFLKDYETRFVTIAGVIEKRETRDSRKKEIHDRPEKMLKIATAHHVEFNRLIK